MDKVNENKISWVNVNYGNTSIVVVITDKENNY